MLSGEEARVYVQPIKILQEECVFLIGMLQPFRRLEGDIISMLKHYTTALEQAMVSATRAFRAVESDDKLEPDFKQRLTDFIEQALRHK